MPLIGTRILVAVLAAALALSVVNATFAQTPEQKPAEKPQASDTKENQKKPDDFAEAEKLLAGPAGNPECLWLGRRVVSLLWRDDSGYRLSSSRSLRPVRLSGRAYSGDLSLRREAGKH